MQECKPWSNIFGEMCEDIEGNIEPDAACNGPKGEQGLCKRFDIWHFTGQKARCTFKCEADKDCGAAAGADDYSKLALCDKHKLFHKNFTSCVVGTTSPFVFEPCTASAAKACSHDPNFQMANPKLPLSCVFPRTTADAGYVKGSSYGVCSVLCPNLKVGDSCASLDAESEELKTKVCKLVDVVVKGGGDQKVKACVYPKA
jgi:hypothetical protein